MNRARGFLSYAHEDLESAERLYTDLAAREFVVWFDRRDFRVEEALDEQILNAIRESYFFLILLSPTSVTKDGYIRKEIALAIRMIQGLGLERSFIIPIRIAECQPRPNEIDGLSHFIDLFPDWNSGLQRLQSLLPINTQLPDMYGESPHATQLSLVNASLLGERAAALGSRHSIAVFLDNCLRRLDAVDATLISRKVISIRRHLSDFAACLDLHFNHYCGEPDSATRCQCCGATGCIVHGTIDYGGYCEAEYNDNYISWCSNCFWAYHLFEIDYSGKGPLRFDYATNVYG